MTKEELIMQMFEIDRLAHNFLDAQRTYYTMLELGEAYADAAKVAKEKVTLPALDYRVALRKFHTDVAKMIAEQLDNEKHGGLANQVRELLLTVTTGEF